MSVIELIKYALQAVVAYLRLKNISFYYDIREKHEKAKKDIINEINDLRKNGDSASADRADILRLQLEAQQSKWADISDAYFIASRKSADKD